MQKRISPVEPGSRPELAEIEANILKERGRISPLYQTLLNSPAIAHGWETLLTAIRNKNSLPASIREMIILGVAIINRAPYEFDAHVPHALKAGVSNEQLDALKAPTFAQIPAIFTDLEMAVLRLTEVMTLQIQVPDEVFEPIRASYNDQEVLEVVTTIAAYNMVSRLLNALHVGH